jgi:transposase
MNDAEDIRLKAFRQFKKEIRGSKEYLIVGIDVAKEKHHAFFGTPNGETLFRRLIFDNAIEGFEKLLTQVRAVQVAQGLPKAVFGLEPTANYHKPLGEHLIKCGRMVVLVSGVAVQRNRELLDGRWDKHDAKDAANIADLISQGKCLYYEYPEIGLRDLCTLLSLKKKLKKQEHSYRVRIRNHLLAQYFPELDLFSGRPEWNRLSVGAWILPNWPGASRDVRRRRRACLPLPAHPGRRRIHLRAPHEGRAFHILPPFVGLYILDQNHLFPHHRNGRLLLQQSSDLLDLIP